MWKRYSFSSGFAPRDRLAHFGEQVFEGQRAPDTVKPRAPERRALRVAPIATAAHVRAFFHFTTTESIFAWSALTMFSGKGA